MTIGRLFFFIFVGAASCLWSALALTAQYVRFENRGLFAAIVADAPIDTQQIDTAIAGYNRVLSVNSCNAALYKDVTLLASYGADMAEAKTEAGEDAYLDKTLHALKRLLACTPLDGKAWLDFAVIDIYQEGFTDRALKAYAMSEYASPGESWLAEKRLLFALKFKPLFNAEAKKLALLDLNTLARAHPNRMAAVLEASHLESKEALYLAFAPNE